MSAGLATIFNLNDLAAFDEAHLREVIAARSGALAPAVAGQAFATERPREQQALGELAERIERALSPNDCATFAQARQQGLPQAERGAACRAVLENLYWELVYWKTPVEYDLLTAGEQVHLGALDLARVDGAVVLDAGAGAGRVTLPIARRARKVYAMDAAPSLLSLLEGKLAAANLRNVDLLRGVFRRVPLPDESVDAVVACSAFGIQEARGGDCGLNELKRVTRPGGRIVIVWPGHADWYVRRGFRYTTFPGRLTITFPTLEDAYAVVARFYGPAAMRHLDSTGRPELPFAVLGVNPPRDCCWLTVRK